MICKDPPTTQGRIPRLGECAGRGKRSTYQAGADSAAAGGGTTEAWDEVLGLSHFQAGQGSIAFSWLV